MSRCIVSLGTDNYRRGRQRLKNSLADPSLWGEHFRVFESEEQVAAPLHRQNPYAFKLYAIDAMRKLGFEQILWIDCSVWAVRPVHKVFDVITDQGYICQAAGYYVGSWCNDRTLAYYGLTRAEANSIPMYGNAGFLGLDFRSEIATDFFNKWKQAMTDGQFKGSWTDHRHDMTCGSIIRHQLGMRMESGDHWLEYVNSDTPVLKNETICFAARGIN